MQFIVPQFIDIEDKVLGPISVRQFVTLLIGGALIFIDYELLGRLNNNFLAFIVSAVFLALLTLVFAFFRVNGRPFHYFFLNFISTMKDPRLRLWNKEVTLDELRRERQKPVLAPPAPFKPALTASKLTELALVVDTGGAYHESDPGPGRPQITVERKTASL